MKYLTNKRLQCVLFAFLVSAHIALAQSSKPSVRVDDFTIRHHERLNKLVFAKPGGVQKSANAGRLTAKTLLSFRAYGQQFDLELEPNNELMANLPKAQKARLKQSMHVYKGRIPGIQGSWIRLSRIGKRLSGALWDGNDFYLIDSSDQVSEALVIKQTKRAAKRPYPLIYRVTDIETTASCGSEAAGNALYNYRGLVKELQGQAHNLPKAAQATRKIDVAIIADAQFTQANSTNPQAAVVARMNVVDGIFSEQVGVHLNINEIRALTNNGSLSSADAGGLLSELVEYTAPSRFNNPGIAHLFTGRDLDGNTAGIAYIGVLCRKDYAVGLSMTNGTGTAGALTVAHEIGHNFGAPHDNQDGEACASTPGTFIMNPILNGSTTFSSCSLQQMAPVITKAACITGIVNPNPNQSADVRPVIPANPINVDTGRAFKYVIEVRNGGIAIAQNATAKVTIPEPLIISSVVVNLGQCTHSSGNISCNLGNLAANAVSTITVNLQSGLVPANLTSSVQVAADNDGNTANNSAKVAINVSDNAANSVLFQSGFNTNTRDFVYRDDVFATKQAGYAQGGRVVNNGNGQLQIILGGIDDTDIFDGMSGGWSKNFSLSAAKPVTVSFDYQLTQAANCENDEYSDALLALDGRLVGVNGGSFLFRITGNGATIPEPDKTTGVKHVDIDLGTLSAGGHTITLGGFNNKKTSKDETTTVLFDNVKAVTK